jgi:Flp pilus assembly pilin Flp
MLDSLNMALTLVKDRRGVTAVEYAVVAGVLCVTILAAFQAFGTRLSTFMGGLTL